MSSIDAGPADGVPVRGARVLKAGGIEIAVFRTGDGRLFALRDRCPHREGPLSQGLVHGNCVTCPLHEWVIDLTTGEAVGPDEGRTDRFDVWEEGGRLRLRLPDE
ncbi:MAG: nitrite reductase (NAD(P)H) small subunit [Gammaproteobacteria bacterium]|nr:nitrite reductase (NAD(P)H) small subunit [Gammaproteobacteria bacterium]